MQIQKIKPFNCIKCGGGFVNKSNLKNHKCKEIDKMQELEDRLAEKMGSH